MTDEPPRGLVSRVRGHLGPLPSTTLGLVAAGLALLLPLVTIRLMHAPAWTPRYALIGVEAAIGVPVLLALLRTGARRAAVCALAFAGVAIVSTLLSDNPAMSFFGMDFWGTGCLFLLALVGVWAIGTAAGRDSVNAIERAILVGVVANVAIAMAQVFFDLGRFGAGSIQGQPTGLLGQPVALGELLIAGLWLVMRRSPVVDLRCLSLVVLVSLGVEIAGERVPLVLLPLVVLVSIWRRPTRERLLLPAAVAVGLIVGLAMTQVGSPSDSPAASERLQGSLGSTARVENYLTGWHALVERPILGWGPGRYQAATSSFRTRALEVAGPDSHFTDAHDLPVQYAVTTGLVGLAAFGAWLTIAARRASGPLLGFALLVLVVQLVQPQDITLTPLAFLALGAAATMDGVRRVVPVPAQAVLVVCGAGFAVLVMIGGYHERQAALGSLADARTAARMWPHWQDRAAAAATAELSDLDTPLEQRIAAARGWASAAVARDERDVRGVITQGYFDLIAFDNKSAKEHLDAGLRLSPWSPHAFTGEGIVAQRDGDLAGAIEWFRRALAISPNDELATGLLQAAQTPSG